MSRFRPDKEDYLLTKPEHQMNEGRNEISTEQFASGVYMLEVETSGGTNTIKIVKSK